MKERDIVECRQSASPDVNSHTHLCFLAEMCFLPFYLFLKVIQHRTDTITFYLPLNLYSVSAECFPGCLGRLLCEGQRGKGEWLSYAHWDTFNSDMLPINLLIISLHIGTWLPLSPARLFSSPK